MTRRGWAVVDMPRGVSIFQTTGPWETYSTPARDLRYLIVVDHVMKFSREAVSDFSLYAVSPELRRVQLQLRLSALRDRLLRRREFHYTRSDGSPWTLTLWDVVQRQKEIEMAYNPNDCPEIRWGAPRGSKERETCRQTAPKEQYYRMLGVRHWFNWRYRPGQTWSVPLAPGSRRLYASLAVDRD